VLVGRESLGQELTQILADTASGHGSIVLLAGEAGVGKTRLATENLRLSGLSTLTVTAGPATAAPFGPLVAALRAGWLGVSPTEPAGRCCSRQRWLARRTPIVMRLTWPNALSSCGPKAISKWRGWQRLIASRNAPR
jgi:AAA ATPase domain